MSERPDFAAQIAKNLAYWENFTPEPEFVPTPALKHVHEAGEFLNARTMDKFLTRDASEKKWFEGEQPSAAIWEHDQPLIDGNPRTVAEYVRYAKQALYECRAALDETADIEAAQAEEEYLEKRRIEAELQDLHNFRESTYVRHCRNRAGEIISDEAYAKSKGEKDQLEEDSIELALRLTAADRPALGTGPQTYFVGIVTGTQKPCINVRKRAILPTVAAEKRAPMVKGLEFILSQPDHEYDQFCTFTHGKRVPIDPVSAGWELRQSFAAEDGLHRRLSRMNSEPFMRIYGAEMIFRASEIGSLKHKDGPLKGELIRDEQGRVTAHPHSHVLIHFNRWLKRNHNERLGHTVDEVINGTASIKGLGQPSSIRRFSKGKAVLIYTVGRLYINRAGVVWKTGGEMAEWSRCVWSYWGAHWSIDGAIEKVREACKYCAKPGDVKALSTAELAALDIALFKLHRVQPLGEFADYMRTWRESCLKPRKERHKDGLKLVILPDWNARKRDRKETLAQKRKKKLRAQLRKAKKNAQREMLRLENEERRALWLKAHAKHIEKHGQLELFGPPKPTPPVCPVDLTELPLTPCRVARPPTAFRNRIVARLAPAFYFGPVAEPAIMVWSDNPLTAEDIAGMLKQPFVRQAADACRVQFAAGQAEAERRRRLPPEMRVHTSPVTVGAETARTPFLPALLKASNWEKTAAFAAN